jgi:hypothetical protein
MKKIKTALLAAGAMTALIALTGCNETGPEYAGCSTTNGLSVARGQVLGTVTLDCKDAPERHHMSIRLEFRDKAHPGWVAANSLVDDRRYAHHVFEIRNKCIAGEWRLYVSASATFKGKPSHAEGSSSPLKVDKC